MTAIKPIRRLLQSGGALAESSRHLHEHRPLHVRALSTDALSTAKGFTGNVTFSAQSSTPAAPNRLLATPFSANQINLTWTDNSTNETAFEIDRATNSSFTSGLVTATVAAGVTSYASTGLAVGTTYYYRIRSTVGGSTDSDQQQDHQRLHAAERADRSDGHDRHDEPGQSDLDRYEYARDLLRDRSGD